MALHKQVTKKKKYEPNITLYPGYADKMLIHYDKKAKCYRVTHYSKFGERGKILSTVSQMGPNKPWMRRSWTYQIKFDDEIKALEFAKNKAKERKFESPVFLLQLDV